MSLGLTLLLALGAGLAMPLGALISQIVPLRSLVQRQELDSFVSYFGGGALLAAIALVLLPHGMQHVPVVPAALAFLCGGLVFWRLDRWLARSGGAAALMIGMLLDFVPESILLGAAAIDGSGIVWLLAGMIALQNLPEGFASWQSLRGAKQSRRYLLPVFLLAPWLGPLAAWAGYGWLAGSPMVLGGVMLFCSGGILYLIFDDIAPRAHLSRHDFPALGAVSGFLLGMVGTMLIH